MLQFQLKREAEEGGGGIKCFQKIKRGQQSHLGSMGRKRDTAQ
jgi:hypothetical protein